jgi:glycosyltransferase involved in cell wall biosynthesis
MKIALVHDYLNQRGGAERVVATLHRMFPEAPVFTSLVDREATWEALATADIRPSWMQRLPGVSRHFKAYLPLYPGAFEAMDLRAYDLVISSSSAFAKSVVTRPDAFHLCYCHTPLRAAWDYERYVAREKLGLARLALPPVIRRIRDWDRRTAARPDLFVANARVVAERIRRCYGRASVVVPPPVEIARCRPGAPVGDYWLVLSRLIPYKRIDLAVEAFNRLGLPLVIIGDGPDRRALEAIARPNVVFLGYQDDAACADHLARCRGLVFPGVEDFGITPLEANASGRPVVAFRAGGALDTVVEGLNGVFFDDATPAALAAAVRRADAARWDPGVLQAHAATFSEDVFMARMRDLIARVAPRWSTVCASSTC